VIENDLLDAIVALPTDLFYNTGIATYIWILDNDKPASRKGTVQLVDATDQWVKMRKSLGSKRREIGAEQITNIVKLYGNHEQSDASKIFRNDDFGYTTITVERPLRLTWAITPERVELALASKSLSKLSDDDLSRLRTELAETAPTSELVSFTKVVKDAAKRANVTLAAAQLKSILDAFSERDETAPIVTDAKGIPVPDTDLRDTENVPLTEDIDDYIAREIAPHVEHFWVDRSKDKIGYEIPFTRHFYKYVPPRSLQEIDADLNTLVREITLLLQEVERA
jgi:type I restriction enzyme M protein